MIFILIYVKNIGMMSSEMKYAMDMNMEQDHTDQENMAQHLMDFHASLKIGNPEDAIRALQALSDSGFTMPKSTVSGPISEGVARAPKVHFTKYIPPWKQNQIDTNIKVDQIIEPVAEPVDEPIAEMVAEPVDEPIAEMVAETVAEHNVVVKMTEEKPSVSKDLKKILKKIKDIEMLMKKPQAELDVDQQLKIEKLGEFITERDRLTRIEENKLKKQQRMIQLKKDREEAMLIQERIDGVQEQKRKSVWKIPKNTETSSHYDEEESESDNEDLLLKKAEIVQFHDNSVAGKQHSLREAALAEMENTVGATEWTSTIKVQKKKTERTQQYAYHAVTGAVTRWNGNNGHVETCDIKQGRNLYSSNGVFFDGRNIDGNVAVGKTMRFDVINNTRGGLSAVNGVMLE